MRPKKERDKENTIESEHAVITRHNPPTIVTSLKAALSTHQQPAASTPLSTPYAIGHGTSTLDPMVPRSPELVGSPPEAPAATGRNSLSLSPFSALTIITEAHQSHKHYFRLFLFR